MRSLRRSLLLASAIAILVLAACAPALTGESHAPAAGRARPPPKGLGLDWTPTFGPRKEGGFEVGVGTPF